MGRPSMGEQPLPRQGWTTKGVDKAVRLEFKFQAEREGRMVGECLTEAMREWLERRAGAKG